MPQKIQFRLGDVVPNTETLDVGEPLFDPTNNALGMGLGGGQPLWYPGIDVSNQDLILRNNSLLRSDAGGTNARFGFDSTDQFSLYITSGLKFRLNKNGMFVYSRAQFNGGGTLSGNFDTSGGQFTNLNAQGISIGVSAPNNQIILNDANGNQLGAINSYGVTSLQSQDLYVVLAGYMESMAQFNRNMFSSGLVSVREYSGSRPFNQKYKLNMGDYSAMAIHNHPNWQNICGLGELSLLINGYHIQTKHNDYILARPINTTTFGDRSVNSGPQVSSTVNNLPLGYSGVALVNNLNGTQVQWMQNVWTNNPEQCIYELAYMEFWIQAWDGNYTDMNSFNPQTMPFIQNVEDLIYYLRSGFKSPYESNPILTPILVDRDSNGNPVFGYLNYRISSIPVATMSPTMQNVTLDGTTYLLRGMPYDPVKAANGVVDSTNRFMLRRMVDQLWFTKNGRVSPLNIPSTDPRADLVNTGIPKQWTDVVNSVNAYFNTPDLEELCWLCPGFDGQENFDNQADIDPNGETMLGQFNNKVQFSSLSYQGLNYYSNAASVNFTDASGFQSFLRGFGDLNFFTAKTSKTQVLGGYTFMMPLEMVVRTPRANWNPLGVVQNSNPTGDGSAGNPYSGYSNLGCFYTLPADFLGANVVGGTNGVTQADTGGTAYVQTPFGIKQMYASGIRIFDVDVTPQRCRFPLVPDSSQFTGLGREFDWFKYNLKYLLKQVAAGNISGTTIDNAF